MESAPLIAFEDATLGYGRRIILQNLTFSLAPTDYLGIVGPNGSGKTTLLKAILGLLPPLSGRIVRPRPIRFGYVPQARTTDDLFPMTALDIVLMGRCRQRGLLRGFTREDRDASRQALADVGLADASERLFRELSGGQRQRVAVARALAAEPEALVLDEPTSAMDIAASAATMELIGELHDQRHLLIVLVSHALNDVAAHAGMVALLGGSHVEIGPVERVVEADSLRELFGREFVILERDGRRMVL